MLTLGFECFNMNKNSIMNKFNICTPPVIWGTLENNQEYFISLLKSVYPIEYEIILAEEGFIVMCLDPEGEELIAALGEMGWDIDTGWVRNQIHPDAFLIKPLHKEFLSRDDEEDCGFGSGNPDFWP